MRALIQRVTHATVTIDDKQVAEISKGILVLLGVKTGDTRREAEILADKCLNLRIFDDSDGVMNLSLADIKGDILAVSQFTLYGDARKGRRPTYIDAAPQPVSEPLYNFFVERLRLSGLNVQTGHFGANMAVALVNDGPVTILIEKDPA